MDFTPVINALMSGGLQGYQMAEAKKKADADAVLKKQQLGLERAKLDETLGKSGYKYNDKTGSAEIDPDFYTPPNAVTPETMNSLSQAQMAAGAAGSFAPPTANPASAVASVRDSVVPMPQGNPSYLRAQRAMELSRGEKAGANNPGNTLADEIQQAEWERMTGAAPGTAKGFTRGQVAETGKYISGQTAASGRSSEALKGANDRAAAAIAAENKRLADKLAADKARADADRASREKLAKQKPSANPGEAAVNKKVGEDYATYTLAGGKAKNEADMASIQSQIDRLRSHNQNILSRGAGFFGKGAQDLVDPEMASIRDALKNAFTGSAKENFPGRMTNSEFNQFIDSHFNPRLGPEENAKRAERILNKMKSSAAARNATAEWFRNHGGDMSGFTPPTVDDNLDYIGDTEPLNPSQLRAQAAKSGGVSVNGGVIPKNTVDKIKSMPTKGTQSAPKIGATKIIGGVTYLRTARGWEEQ